MVGVYFSGTGNTRYCIGKFVHGLEPDAACIGIEHPSAAQAMAQSDFIVLAYPIYFSNLPKIMRDFLESNRSVFSGKKVFILATMGLFSGDGTGCAARLLIKYGADIAGGLHLKMPDCITDSNLNHTGIYLYSKGKIMIHLTFDYQSDEGCTTPGQYLRYHRTFQGLTTRELAEKVGVVPATLVLYENDRHPIKHSTAVALANVLGIDRSRLLDEYTVFVDYPYSSLLKKVRRELSFTQMQMAEVIGIGQTTYSGWEREVRVPRRKEHEKILAAMKKLKVDVDTYLCQPNPL